MLSHEDNRRVTQVGRDTPMGTLMRRYWLPALLAWELPDPDGAPVRVKLLGEELVAFRDSQGRIGAATRTAACAACTTAGSSTSRGAAWT
jgi:hypothetical protein